MNWKQRKGPEQVYAIIYCKDLNMYGCQACSLPASAYLQYGKHIFVHFFRKRTGRWMQDKHVRKFSHVGSSNACVALM